MNTIKKNKQGKVSPMTFREFLQDHHSSFYVGSDDDMPDAYDSWTSDLQADEWEDLGEQYGVMLRDSVND